VRGWFAGQIVKAENDGNYGAADRLRVLGEAELSVLGEGIRTSQQP
jgi:hypothetical protein